MKSSCSRECKKDQSASDHDSIASDLFLFNRIYLSSAPNGGTKRRRFSYAPSFFSFAEFFRPSKKKSPPETI